MKWFETTRSRSICQIPTFGVHLPALQVTNPNLKGLLMSGWPSGWCQHLYLIVISDISTCPCVYNYYNYYYYEHYIYRYLYNYIFAYEASCRNEFFLTKDMLPFSASYLVRSGLLQECASWGTWIVPPRVERSSPSWLWRMMWAKVWDPKWSPS